MTDWTGIGQFVAQLGFPVAVAVFVLVRLNGKLERLTEAMVRLEERMLRLVDLLDRRDAP